MPAGSDPTDIAAAAASRLRQALAGDADAPENWRNEFTCKDRDDACQKAAERQREEPEDSEIEWIYLRNDNHRWVVRRVQRHPAPEPPPKKSIFRTLLDAASSAPWGP